jgi:hypothetical protein
VCKESLSKGACFYSLQHEAPVRLDCYRARVVDGLGQTIHERLFVVEIDESGEPMLRDLSVLGNLTPAAPNNPLPLGEGRVRAVASLPEPTAWLNDNALLPFLNEVRAERLAEVDRISAHIELSLTELLQKADEEIGRAATEVEQKVQGAQGRFVQAEERHAKLLERRERRRQELGRQRSLTLQGVERITGLVILPHPEQDAAEVRRLKPDPETEAMAMKVVIDYEKARGCQVDDVHEKNLGYDITSLDLNSGELRLIEIKGLGGASGSVLLTPNERRVAEDRPDCYWLYVVTECKGEPKLQEPIKDPARLQWHEVVKVAHYYLSVDALRQPMLVREAPEPYGGDK